jgi:hypothetical protein
MTSKPKNTLPVAGNSGDGAESTSVSGPDSVGKPVPGKQPARSGTPQSPEIGGREGLDPTRFGDWEKDGRCVDF